MNALLSAILARLPRLPRFSDRASDLFVVADPFDSTVTLSPALASHIAKHCGQQAALIIVFRLAGTDRYGFAPATDSEKTAQLAALDYDKSLRCWGFTSVTPTIAQIFSRWNLPPLDTQKLSVAYRRRAAKPFYELCRP